MPLLPIYIRKYRPLVHYERRSGELRAVNKELMSVTLEMFSVCKILAGILL